MEVLYPVLYLQGEWITDTAAPGKWRGNGAFWMRRMSTTDSVNNHIYVQARLTTAVGEYGYDASLNAGGTVGELIAPGSRHVPRSRHSVPPVSHRVCGTGRIRRRLHSRAEPASAWHFRCFVLG